MTNQKLETKSRFSNLDKNKCEYTSSKVGDVYSIKHIISKYDLEGNGHISQEEMDVIERVIELESKKAKEEDRDKREDAMRKMTWFALFGMLLYPVTIMLTVFLGLEAAADIIGNIAPTYFIAISALVAAYFGAQAYTNKQD